MTFEEASLLPRSEKITLITIDSAQQVKIFNTESSFLFSKQVNYFVSGVSVEGVALTKGSSESSLGVDEWFFVPSEMKVYISIAVNPSNLKVILFYTHFFSNSPVILPYDLSYGEPVEWLPYISATGSIGQTLDDENTGVVLESSSSVSLINQGYFDSIFDTLIWENKKVSFYYWFPITPITETKKIFEGIVESKTYTIDKISFNVKDFVFRLKDKINLGSFPDTSSVILDTYLGKPKRRIYGKVDKCQAVGIDCTKDGYQLTGLVSISNNLNTLTGTVDCVYVSNDLSGTIAGNSGTKTITGTGTSFTTQISPNQKLKVTNGLVSYTYTVRSVNSATSITVTENISATFSGFSSKNYSIGNKKVYGTGTKFLEELQNGNSIQFFSGVVTYNYRVESIQSNTELTVSEYITTSLSSYGIKNLDIKNNVLNGSSTLFMDELSPNDEIVFIVDGEKVKYTIESVASNTVALLTNDVTQTVTASDAYIVPKIPYRKKNRQWNLAGHPLSESTCTITTVVNARQFVVSDPSEFSAGDVVKINSTLTAVTRISGSQIVLEQSIFPVPSSGDSIVRRPVMAVYFNNKLLNQELDYTLVNSTEAIIEFNDLAEFNIAKESFTSISLDFTNGSNIIKSQGGFDLTKIINPRDWIRSFNQSNATWFEVLSVQKDTIQLRTNYSESTNSSPARIKNVEIINDDSLITADCYGYSYEGKWIKTASNTVRHLVKNDAGFTSINETTFTQSDSDCDYLLSMVIPENIGESSPLIRDVITKVNDSVFGSLYGNTSQEICYSIVNTRRSDSIQPFKDDDIISWSSDSKNTIANIVNVKYSPFIDTIKSELSYKNYSFSSSFVNDIVGINNKKEVMCYLYSDDDAQTIAQRYAFFNSISQLKVTLKAKALFFSYSVNDRIYINLDHLYKRYASGTRLKMGIVSSVKRSEFDSEIVLNDLGNIFNRCPSISTDTTPSYISSTDDDKVKFGFILDSNTLIPGSNEEDLGSCLIG